MPRSSTSDTTQYACDSNTLEIWIKTGYISEDGAKELIDEGKVLDTRKSRHNSNATRRWGGTVKVSRSSGT